MSGIYIGTMGMISNIQKVNVHSNNIANIDTNGYKADKTTFRSFEELLKKVEMNGTEKNIGNYKDKVYIDDFATNFDAGLYQMSDRNLDLALKDGKETGEVSFFSVSKGEQTYLTRNGFFQLDTNRALSLPNGAYVLNEEGNKITIPENTKYSFQKDGTILGDSGEVIDKIQIKSVEKDHLGVLRKEHGGLFRAMNLEEVEGHFGPIEKVLEAFDNNPTIQSVFKTKDFLEKIQNEESINILKDFSGNVNQGEIEGSNVNMVEEMIELMNAQKGVTSSQKVTTTLFDILRKEANELGK